MYTCELTWIRADNAGSNNKKIQFCYYGKHRPRKLITVQLALVRNRKNSFWFRDFNLNRGWREALNIASPQKVPINTMSLHKMLTKHRHRKTFYTQAWFTHTTGHINCESIRQYCMNCEQSRCTADNLGLIVPVPLSEYGDFKSLFWSS